MKLIRRILRYLLLLAFIVVLFCAYYYRALIFSEYINAKVDNAINGVLVMSNIVPDPADAETREVQGLPDCVPVENETQAEEIDVVKVEVEITQPDTVDSQGNDRDTDKKPAQAVSEVQVTVIDADLAAEQVPATAASEDQTTEVEVEQRTEEEPTPVPVPAEEESNIESTLETNAGAEGEEVAQKSHFELINQARHVYQCGDISNSIDLYRELGELYPDDPNVYGELGNVLYSKGEWKQASLAYYEAALRLQKRNQQDQIHYLYRVIQGLDPETAEKLRSRLSS